MESNYHTIKRIYTDTLEIAYIDKGPGDAPVALMLHGWPDDVHGMIALAEKLQIQGYRTIIPWLRGFGPTRFLDKKTIRDGRGVALAKDAIDLLDALKINSCILIGHDWGGRTGYHLAALVPERLNALVTLGIGYSPNGSFTIPNFKQSRLWWYQWFMMTEGGCEKIEQDPIGFAHIQWETWSPKGWFNEKDFSQTSESFLNPDWPAITLNGYRSRWTQETVDSKYTELQAKIESTKDLCVPTLIIVGAEDYADFPEESKGSENCFKAGFRRIILNNVGHFPAREAANDVAENIWLFLH